MPASADRRPDIQSRVKVWDVPTRLFHWSLALCTLAACISAELGGDQALRLHFLSGYAVLILVVFRMLWGFAGPRYARFGQFVRGPAATVRYALALLRGTQEPSYAGRPGHNPLGAVSVLALLAICAVQAASGLFSSDAIASEGPLARFVSEAAVKRCTALHAWGETILYALVAVHLLAIAFYRLAKGENLLTPMLTGTKNVRAISTDAAVDATDDPATRARALLLLALSTAFIALLVTL